MLFIQGFPYGSAAAGIPSAEMGIAQLKFVLQNQDDDYAEIVFKHPWKGDPPAPFDVDREILFYEIVDGSFSRLFRGIVATPSFSATGTTSQKKVVVKGPWGQFKTTPFAFMYPYVTGTASSNHGILSGDINQLLTTILTQNASAIVDIGTINVGNVTIPTTDVSNQTLAQVIQAILRYVPDAVVFFDYSASTRTRINILIPSKITRGMADFSLGATPDFNITPRHDRLVNYVSLGYEQSRTARQGNFWEVQDGSGQSINTATSPSTTISGFHIVGSDSAGTPSGRRRFHKILRATGTYDVTTYRWQGALWSTNLVHDLWTLQHPGPGISGTRAGIDVEGWASFFRLFSPSSGQLHYNRSNAGEYPGTSTQRGSLSISDRQYLTAGSFNDSGLRAVIGFGPSYYYTPDIIKPLGYNIGVSASKIPSVFLSGSSYVRAMTCSVNWSNFYQIQPPNGVKNYAASNILFVQNMGSGNTFDWSKTVTTVPPSPFTPGIAATILAANSRLLYDGSYTMRMPADYPMENVLRYFHSVRVVELQNFNNAATPIQRVRVDWFARSYSVEMGAPEHLGPQDLIALAKAGEAL